MAFGEGKNRRQTTVGKGALDGGCGLPQPVTSVTGLAMTRFFARGTVGFFVVRRGGALPLPRATARVAPTEMLVGADDPVRPYESVTRGAMGGRPQGSPLRKRYKRCGANPGPTTQHLVGQGPCALPGVRYGIGGRTGASGPTEGYKGCNGRATARVAPTKAYLAVRRGGALPLPRAG